jgi:trehalose utilization protein
VPAQVLHSLKNTLYWRSDPVVDLHFAMSRKKFPEVSYDKAFEKIVRKGRSV